VPGVRVVHPQGLSEPAVADLARGRLGGAPETAFVHGCDLATGGNPFLLGELLAELERRAVERRPRTRLSWKTSHHAALGGSCERVCEGSPAVSRTRSLGLHSRRRAARGRCTTAGLDDAAGSVAADSLASAGLLESRHPLAFVHPLVRSSAEHRRAVGVAPTRSGHARRGGRCERSRRGSPPRLRAGRGCGSRANTARGGGRRSPSRSQRRRGRLSPLCPSRATTPRAGSRGRVRARCRGAPRGRGRTCDRAPAASRARPYRQPFCARGRGAWDRARVLGPSHGACVDAQRHDPAPAGSGARARAGASGHARDGRAGEPRSLAVLGGRGRAVRC
jgi:hypothetical protein